MEDIFADIIIDISHEALDKIFQYRVPFSLCEVIKAGDKVLVPFGKGNRATEGYVIAVGNEPSYDVNKIKNIIELVEGSRSVESDLIETAAFIRYQYGSSMIQALHTVMPVKEKKAKKQQITVELALDEEQTRSYMEECKRKRRTTKIRLIEALLQKGSISKEEATKECKVALKELYAMEAQGILHLQAQVVYRNPYGSFTKTTEALVLNDEQQIAFDAFACDFRAGIAKTYLLHGVTGSGKTEVYLAMIEEVLKAKKQAIVLIPEISLTYQTVRRFAERFGQEIVVIHSRMSMGERSDACEQVEKGLANVVIGARSALFAPMKNLGLIVIDEEHDGAYKSDKTPKYHARETALFRAELAGASVVLGSATPSVESYTRALAGEYELLTLRERAKDAQMPSVELVDLREEFRQKNYSMFSRSLHAKMRDRLEKGEQIMLFLNRRGFAGFVSCRACGTVVKCPHCDVSLTYHRNNTLHCHYCGYETPYSQVCSVCHSPHVAAFGLGTQKVESALQEEFPEARVLRMDADTTRKKGDYEAILGAFSRGEADILLGTQMIVKGHDYPNVTLVGILAADLSLHGSHFRSGELTFQLLCQAAGRAGRGEKPGEVVIQSYSTDHYAIQTAATQSYGDFFREEFAFRRLLRYPPCAHLLVILVQCGDESQAILAAQRIQRMVAKSQEEEKLPVQILNPGKAAIAKIKDTYRQVIYLKHPDGNVLLDLKDRLEPVLEKHPMFAGLSIQFDFDPLSYY